MPITFSCKKHASVVMLEANALTLINMMGHSGAVPGVIKADHAQSALACLNKNVESNIVKPVAELDDSNDADSAEDVALGNRSLPLRQMLSFAADKGYDVMWE